MNLSATDPTDPTSPTDPTDPTNDEFESHLEDWHRRITIVGDILIVTGDLHHRESKAEAQLTEWVANGAIGIIDCRIEWSDEQLVAQLAPEVAYHHVGVDDHGGTQSDEWFTAGVTAGLELLSQLETSQRIVVHCHMGVNRGPSMAFAILLSLGWGITESLSAIRAARPIAGLIYAGDAVEWFGRRQNWTPEQVADAMSEVATWQEDNDLDIAAVIRRIRNAQ